MLVRTLPQRRTDGTATQPDSFFSRHSLIKTLLMLMVCAKDGGWGDVTHAVQQLLQCASPVAILEVDPELSAFKSKLAHVARAPEEYSTKSMYLGDVFRLLKRPPIKHRLAPLRAELERITRNGLEPPGHIIHSYACEMLISIDLGD